MRRACTPIPLPLVRPCDMARIEMAWQRGSQLTCRAVRVVTRGRGAAMPLLEAHQLHRCVQHLRYCLVAISACLSAFPGAIGEAAGRSPASLVETSSPPACALCASRHARRAHRLVTQAAAVRSFALARLAFLRAAPMNYT